MVLAVTGAEALYADMGHFGRRPITFMWLALVYPACTLSYLGQGALVLDDPAHAIANPFFLLVPSWGRIPMIVLATAATVIASQAVISGAFSVTRQAAQLGYLPRLRIAHTSEEQIGQIYVPWINWALLVAVLGLVFLFKHSAALAYAYGMAVTCTITITTLLFFYIARHKWGWPLWVVLSGGGVLIAVDLLFVAVNLTKFTHGAWLPLLIGLVVFTVLVTWQKGREIVTRRRQEEEGPLRRVRRRVARPQAAAGAGSGDGHLLEPGQGDRAAGDARERRAQSRAARARHRLVHRDGPGAAHPARAADHRHRRPRLHR